MKAKTMGCAATPFSRRRAITILAAALPLAKAGVALAAAPAPLRWQGVAMGARAQIILIDQDPGRAQAALAAAVTELSRLEALFSIYEPASEISRLNRDGALSAPSPDLLRLLSEARGVSEATGGAFDVTMQPLFLCYRAARGAVPQPADLAAARALVDYRKLVATPSHLAFARPGMAVSLNGIAQGYITDRVSELLQGHGFRRSLIDLGEIKANAPDLGKAGWPVAIADPEKPDQALARLALSHRAVATSAASGYAFGGDPALHHLIDPNDGRPAGHYQSLSVLAPNATLADGFSTGFSMLAPDRLPQVLAAVAGVEVVAKTAAGKLIRL